MTDYLDDNNLNYIVHLEAEAAVYRRLVRWLSLTYGTNLPKFHGAHKAELEGAYIAALFEDDGDQSFAYQADQATAKPDPEGPFATPPGMGANAIDDLDQVGEMVELDERGNTAGVWRREGA
jgi:hypothetical protein